MDEGATPRSHELQEVFNGLRYIVKTGAPWRWMPNDLQPWEVLYQQTPRLIRQEVFAGIDGAKRRKGTKVHMAGVYTRTSVDLHVTLPITSIEPKSAYYPRRSSR